jgi:hypothetical protein
MQRPSSFLIPLLTLAAGCATTSPAIPQAWLSVPATPRIGSVVLAEGGEVTTSPERAPRQVKDGPIQLAQDAVGPRIANGLKLLTDPFLEVDSLDFSESRGEVAFSARRDDDFDVGLVSSDGSPISWLPDDPADEVAVQWAPRGNKVSYVIRAKGGDVVRTLHVPTSYQFAVPFDGATVHALAWDPPAERYAAVYSTLTAADAVDVLKYDGTDRKTVIAPSTRLEADVDTFAGGGVLLRPRDVRYDEKLPLVVWRAADLAWSDERAALLRSARVALVVTRDLPDEAFWRAAQAVPWLDTKRVFVVAPNAAPIPNATLITTDQALAAGHYSRRGSVVAVPPAVVQSFAAGFIADQLKRTTPANGSSR